MFLLLGLASPPGLGPSPAQRPDAPSLRPADAPGAQLSPIAFTGVSPAAATLDWVRSLDLCFREYELAYTTAGGLGPWTTWATYPDVNAVSAFVYGFAPGTTVWWRLVDRACDGTELPSEVAVPHPSAATLSVRAVDATSLELAWDNQAVYTTRLGFGRYEVMESVDGGPWTVSATILDPGTRTFVRQAVSSSSAYAFYVSTTDVCRDCSTGPTASTTSSNTVSFGAPQPIAARTEASRTAADVGQSISFACAASGGTAPYAYGWTFGDGATAAGASVTHAYAEPGTKRATCTATDSVSARTTSWVDVSVSPAPEVTASVDPAAAAPGTVLSFSMVASGGPGTFTRYDWSFGDGSVGSGPTATHPYANPGSYAASAIVTDGNGGTASDYVVVSITEIVVDADSSTTGAAPGEPITFTASARGGAGGPYEFTWAFGDGATGTGASVSHAYADRGNYTPVVTATDRLGAVRTKELPMIGVGGPLVASVAAFPSAPHAREAVTLRASPRGGAGGYTCTWTFGDDGSGTGCTVTHAWAVAGTYAVSVTVQDRAEDRVVADGQVTVLATLAVTIDVSPSEPAPDEAVSFAARPTGGSGSYACRWTFESSSAPDEVVTGCNATYRWSRSGSYRISLVVNDTEGHGVIAVRTVQVGSPTRGSVFGLHPLVPIGALITAGVVFALWRSRTTFRSAGRSPDPDPAVLESIDAFVDDDLSGRAS